MYSTNIQSNYFNTSNKTNYSQNYCPGNYNQNQQLNPLICDNCLIKNSFICQCCNKPFQRINFNSQMNYNEGPNQQNYNNQNDLYFNPTRKNPRIIISKDEYCPMLGNTHPQNNNKVKNVGYIRKVYNKNYNRARDNAKVEIIYDEYTPIKVDYELKKPGITIKKLLYVKKEKIEKNESDMNKENIEQKDEKVEKIIKEEEKMSNENKNEEKDIEPQEEKNIEPKESLQKEEENEKEENIIPNEQQENNNLNVEKNNINAENDVVEYKILKIMNKKIKMMIYLSMKMKNKIIIKMK